MIGSLMSQKEIIKEYVAINHKLNSIHDVSKDFPHLAMTKHFTDVIPYTLLQPSTKNNSSDKDDISLMQLDNSIMFQHYRGNNAKFK
jgi:hypothetical protein